MKQFEIEKDGRKWSVQAETPEQARAEWDKQILPTLKPNVMDATLSPHVGAATQGAADTMTLGFKDEILAGAAAPFRAGYDYLAGNNDGKGVMESLGDAYGTELDNQRNIQKSYQEAAPKSYFGGQMAGAVATPGAAKNLAPVGIGRGALRGAGVGGATGAAYGFGSGEGFDDRKGQALVGGLLGGGAGGVLGAATGAVSNVARIRARARPDKFKKAYKDAIENLDAEKSMSRIKQNDVFGTPERVVAPKQQPKPQPRNAKEVMLGVKPPAAKGTKVAATRGQFKEALDDITNEALSEQTAPKSYAFVDTMHKAAAGKKLSAKQLHHFRTNVNKRLVNNPDPYERAGGRILRDEIDTLIEDMGAISPKYNAQWRTARKLQLIEEAVNRADEIASRGSQNYNRHLSGQLNKLVQRDVNKAGRGLPTQYSEAERKFMTDIASHKGHKMVELIGYLSPDSPSRMIANALMFGIGGPNALSFQVPAAMAGYGAKKASQNIARSNVAALQNRIAGAPAHSPYARKVIDPADRASAVALTPDREKPKNFLRPK